MSNNLVKLIGILGQAPRFFKTKQKKEAVSLSVGTRNSYKDQESNEWKSKATVWHNDIFGFSSTMVETCKSFKHKDLIELEGELEYRKFIDNEGNKRTSPTIILKKIAHKII